MAPASAAAPALSGRAEATVLRILPPARPGRFRLRHHLVALSFVLGVALPAAISAWYLWTRAADQYASTVAFSVHQEQTESALSLLRGFASISGSGSADTDILYEYIFSQPLVAEIDTEVGLRALWSKAEGDPVFAFDPEGTIEDLVSYWEDMVTVYYNASTRLIEIRVLAFDAEDARRISTAVFARSNAMINRLNDIAAADMIRYTQEELAEAEAELRAARQAVTDFRNRHQLVDPAADLAAQSGILAGLQQELAAARVELDLLRDRGAKADPRIGPMEQRIQVIETRIAAERQKLGLGNDGEGEVMADVVAEYERLQVDRGFAETAYAAARAAHEAAQTEARRQSRYLAPHIAPTLAESARFPERGKIMAVVAVFLFMLWGIAVMLYYSLRDRR
ncbi:capsule biosynthesis protein [Rhodobacter sp. Har01]|uniref:capsule biosynthesis protein n=1 Tax=Rhodobacter sp. Har01 TaxID=2883999 RepID=UPI001D08F3BA|nr:capsule biosynthesis protein [Rhodobacter sp. Har01]MCB6178374.1 capsule biosynthesis protein [Rhodobacter sp. Har01]